MGRPKPLLQVIRENPDMANSLIIMPLDASNAGKNYGTGGDFTANSAPYVGARGGSEFWARSAKFGSNSILKWSLYSTQYANKKRTFVIIFRPSDTVEDTGLFVERGNKFRFYRPVGSAYYQITMFNSSASQICTFTITSNITVNQWNTIFVSVDLAVGAAYCKVNSSLFTATTNLNEVIADGTEYGIAFGDSGSRFNGEIATLYYSKDYIDFSQETNRNKFVDQLGYPKDLKAQIDAGVIPQPLIYLPFDDSTNLGKNLGLASNFTIDGTVISGADVLG